MVRAVVCLSRSRAPSGLMSLGALARRSCMVNFSFRIPICSAFFMASCRIVFTSRISPLASLKQMRFFVRPSRLTLNLFDVRRPVHRSGATNNWQLISSVGIHSTSSLSVTYLCVCQPKPGSDKACPAFRLCLSNQLEDPDAFCVFSVQSSCTRA